ncbi:hypothetical protein Y695_03755 [Hydrogenophaga sp. T4]|nr:hypothetical protein Y695_03755 [Hydrogenophaga sp. T4]
MPPVSVCHQLSWNGRPNALTPQTTASGLSGSPTLAMKRNAERSTPCRASAPSFIIMRMAVGAVYQTVMRSRSSTPYQVCGSNSASTTTLVTPHTSGAMMP